MRFNMDVECDMSDVGESMYNLCTYESLAGRTYPRQGLAGRVCVIFRMTFLLYLSTLFQEVTFLQEFIAHFSLLLCDRQSFNLALKLVSREDALISVPDCCSLAFSWTVCSG